MRELDLHIPFDAVEELGFDLQFDGERDVEVLDVTLLSCGKNGSTISVTYSNPVDQLLDESAAIEWFERVRQTESEVTYLCQAVPIRHPQGPPRSDTENLNVQSLNVTNDGYTVTFVGKQATLREDSEWMDHLGSLRILRLTEYQGSHHRLDCLTDRQREVLETANAMGYYEVPRETTASDVAARLGVQRATVTEHLQRAERKLVTAFLSD